jgi:hypothetical protein
VEAAAVPARDRETLKGFFRSLRELLEHLTQDPHGLLRPELRPLVAEAGEELVAEGRFEEIERLIDSGEYEQDLIDHGLRGAQLAVKVATYESALETMQGDEQSRVFSKKRLRQSMPGVLTAANVPVDSVAAFIPPVAGVKELKSVVEAAVAHRARIGEAIRRGWRRVTGRRDQGVPAEVS